MAGFSPEQELVIEDAASASLLTRWECGEMPGADAWMLNGQLTQYLGDGRVRVGSKQPGGRSVQLQLPDMRRPVVFAGPLPASVQAPITCDLDEPHSVVEAIGVLEFTLAPLAAKYLLAAHVIEHQEMLGTGAFELRARGQLLAVVDMTGDASVLPSVRPANFELAVWKKVDRTRVGVPDNFSRVSMSELMWRYVSRTSRILLPERYLTVPIFFRRAPRVDPVLVDEEHLLVMRELAIHPLTFEEMQRALDLAPEVLARVLSALYYVGSVTSTRARASTATVIGEMRSSPPLDSHYGELRAGQLELVDLRQLTAPGPLAPAA
ncbi:MAG TPA: hypothetical protein VIE63_12685 [Ramlibacter sp.]